MGIEADHQGLLYLTDRFLVVGDPRTLMQVVQVFPATAKGKGKQRGSTDGDWVILLIQRKVT